MSLTRQPARSWPFSARRQPWRRARSPSRRARDDELKREGRGAMTRKTGRPVQIDPGAFWSIQRPASQRERSACRRSCGRRGKLKIGILHRSVVGLRRRTVPQARCWRWKKSMRPAASSPWAARRSSRYWPTLMKWMSAPRSIVLPKLAFSPSRARLPPASLLRPRQPPPKHEALRSSDGPRVVDQIVTRG